MYNTYKEEISQKGKVPVSLYIFREIFNTEFNLSFKRPKTDSCKTCDKIDKMIQGLNAQAENERATITEKQEKKQEALQETKRLEEHHLLVEKIRKTFKEEVEAAKGNEKVKVLTFDLQKVLVTPKISTNQAYYCRQLQTFNLCIYDEGEKQGYMYMWTELDASRGSQEIASCLFEHLRSLSSTTVEEIILYSDSCGGQNRNIKMTLMLKWILLHLPDNILKITQKFLVSGHSFNNCDASFALIDSEAHKHQIISSPDDWIKIIESANRKHPFKIRKLNNKDFYSAEELERLIVNRKYVKEGRINKKISWLKFHQITYDRRNLFELDVEYYDGQTFEIKIGKKGVNEERFSDVQLKELWPDGREISKEKKKDLMTLLPYINVCDRDFYERIMVKEDVTDFCYDTDEEEVEEN